MTVVYALLGLAALGFVAGLALCRALPPAANHSRAFEARYGFRPGEADHVHVAGLTGPRAASPAKSGKVFGGTA